MDTQKVLVEHHVSKVKESLGTDVEKIASEVFSMQGAIPIRVVPGYGSVLFAEPGELSVRGVSV